MVHEERLQQETQERMLREEDRREHADKLVTHMEEQEEVAIERLRRAQDAQKAAYEELERALTNPPPPIEQRQAMSLYFLQGGRGGNLDHARACVVVVGRVLPRSESVHVS